MIRKAKRERAREIWLELVSVFVSEVSGKRKLTNENIWKRESEKEDF